jgi:hypothetical protein
MTVSTTTSSTTSAGPSGPLTRVACGAAAALAVVPFAVCSFEGDTGEGITASLADRAVPLQLGAIVATVAGALLVLAAVVLGRRVAGTAGRVVAAAGVAVAVLFVAYYASFGVGGLLAGEVIAEPDPAIGIATSFLVNLTEITRYAPGVALVVAAVAARRRLPAGVWGCAAVLALMTVVPFTSWVAALLIPLWLAVSAAVVGDREA